MGSEAIPDGRHPPATIAHVVAEAWHANVELDLGREETTYLAAIHAYLQDASGISLDVDEPHLDDTTLRRIFSLIHELAQSGNDSEVQRATLMIGRLRRQGILLRIDDTGLLGDGEFTLSPLGLALARSMEKGRELSKGSLTVVLTHFRTVLVDVVEGAKTAATPQDWESRVLWPLRDIVAELIRMIESRQRGLDMAHAALRREITEHVNAEWADAIDMCKAMILDVHGTLRELHEVLSEHVEHLDRQLFELADYTSTHPHLALLVARTRIQLSRLARWGAKRYDDWNGYYCNAQRFIRDVVQTDPDNLLRTRLTEQIRRFQSRPYGLVAVAPIPFLHLREVRRPVTAAPLAVPAEVLANRVLVEYTQPPPDRVQQAVAALVERLRTDGAIDLVAAARDVAPDFSDDECFQLLIRATPLLLKHGATPLSIHERPWIKLSERLHAQTMTVQVTGTACGAETNVIAEHPSPPFAWHEQGGTS